jgi:Flp pilus assembly secretin CpaC
MQLNLQLGEDKARVLADTTLNGISGQEIKFENTNTFRYRDITIDPETGKPFYTGTTREITSGLVLNINGWVSGDGMITMKVNAAVSKQDESGGMTEKISLKNLSFPQAAANSIPRNLSAAGVR